MALVIRLDINQHRLKTIEVRRVGSDTSPDATNEYRCTDWSAGVPPDSGFTVEHRYGDGAVELARKVLARMAER